MFARLRAAAWASAVIATAPPAHAQLPTITDYTKTFEKRDGSFPLYWDEAKGRPLVEIPAGPVGGRLLFLPWLATGRSDVPTRLDCSTSVEDNCTPLQRDRVEP